MVNFRTKWRDVIYGRPPGLDWHRSCDCPQHSTALPKQNTQTGLSSNSAAQSNSPCWHDGTALSFWPVRRHVFHNLSSSTANHLYRRYSLLHSAPSS